ncbi:MAG: tetratricopeptide repeat protein [Candidatus Erginobacter occultus]|nr:tetratricopeptide repeat protein [Candidatus Erginobacter occultus]
MKSCLLFLLAALAAVPAPVPELNPKARELFDQAFQLLEQGKVYEAIPVYDRALAEAPESPDIWMEYISCLRKAKYSQRAARAGWRALEVGEEASTVWGNLGNVFCDGRAWSAAEEAFGRAAALSEDRRWSAQNFLVLGYHQMICGDSEAAVNSFQAGLKIDPTHGLALIDLGIAKATLGRVPEGVRDLRRGIAMIKYQAKQAGDDDPGGVGYGQAALSVLEEKGGLTMDDKFSRDSFQSLPDRFLKRPKKGEALSLSIDPAVERCFQITPRALVSFTAPESWREEFEMKSGGPVFTYRPESGDEFMLMFSPFRMPEGKPDPRKMLEERGKAMLETSVEANLKMIPIKTPTAEGCVFTLTDRKLVGKTRRGESYLYATQGIVASGQAFGLFTLLSDSRDESFLKEFRSIIGTFAVRDYPPPGSGSAPNLSSRP